VETIQVSYSDCTNAGANGNEIFNKKTENCSFDKRTKSCWITVEVSFGYPYEGKPYVAILYSSTGRPIHSVNKSINPSKKESSWKIPCGCFRVVYESD
jgi:hypothetical protein